jgi:hypothetical protein
MSSQGPATSSSGFISYTGFTGTAIEPGYRFSELSIRDSSDWTTLKKQSIIAKEGPVGGFPSDPWIPFGGDRRLNYLNGRFKNAAFTGCTGCSGSAFSGNGSPYTS